jgi:hypothetical protein
MYPVEDDRDRWWAGRLEWAINHHRDLGERDMDDQLADNLDTVISVQQKDGKGEILFLYGKK